MKNDPRGNERTMVPTILFFLLPHPPQGCHRHPRRPIAPHVVEIGLATSTSASGSDHRGAPAALATNSTNRRATDETRTMKDLLRLPLTRRAHHQSGWFAFIFIFIAFVVNFTDLLLISMHSRPSPTYELPVEDYNPDEPKEDDSEARSVFVSQLAARLTARDLGYFFEDKLGEGAVMDSRIVTDRISRRSKG